MPLNKLDNFIKNTEGRILYVSPSDLDSTDSISNQGNSLAQPFKTVQRALLEAARFSYQKGRSNDDVEKTTILLMPGQHTIDNRPGFVVFNQNGVAKAKSPTGAVTDAADTLSLTLESIFDITQEDNILYKFNSINGGVVVPRGTSIVGLDLRKTKIRPKYVPNPTDPNVPNSSIFRVTGACYFWQFCIFDASTDGVVYTDPADFSVNNQSTPTFSHHKLTVFEYADGVNLYEDTGLTDLDMYYAKLSNAFNLASGRDIDEKYPSNPQGFDKQRPEWEIVGAFASDPIKISTIESGSGGTPSNQITVKTTVPHNLTAGTPIKISGVSPANYNISTKVQSISQTDTTVFTYLLPSFPPNLTTPGDASNINAQVTIETDTVSGASPYIFNISLRSVYGMNGMHADGSKASGFRSMVVAQFTGVSLQKDDRAFVRYNPTTRDYTDGISLSKVTGATLASQSSSLGTVYHLEPRSIYRSGWESSHIKASNDAFIQIVSVFAIGFNKHFDTQSGGDLSITNSNSNFGQISLAAEGFKKEAFEKDDKAFITSIIAPRALVGDETNVDWISLDVGVTTTVGITSHLYLFGFNASDDIPPILTQGYRIGARQNDKLYITANGTEYSADILMSDGVTSSAKEYRVTSGPTLDVFTIGNHSLETGESVIIMSDDGDLPENIEAHTIYYAIKQSNTQIKLAASQSAALRGDAITVYKGTNLRILSRVSDKSSGDLGHPVQFDAARNKWYIKTNANSSIYTTLNTLGVGGLTERTEPSYVKRIEDTRSLDEKIYKIRVVIPKESINAKNPENGFIIQESSTTGIGSTGISVLSSLDYEYNRNPSIIADCTRNDSSVTITSELPHRLRIGDTVVIKNVTDSTNTTGQFNRGYNGTFTVTDVLDDMRFAYTVSTTPGSPFTNNLSIRTSTLPRFERNDLRSNLYIYRNEVISSYIEGIQDGIYHLYVLSADKAIPTEFTNIKYSQNVTDLYPQLDRDNPNDNPSPTKTFAKRSPLGEVVTNDLKRSVTKESTDTLLTSLGVGLNISNVVSSSGIATITFTREHGLAGIVTGSITTPGSGYTPGTYQNVKILNGSQTGTWNGATARVVISGAANSVTSVDITSSGSGYVTGTALYFDQTKIGVGAATKARYTVTTPGITTAIGDVVQFTGAGTTSDTYHRITSVLSKNQIAVAKTAGDFGIGSSQYAFIVGPSVRINSTTYSSSTGLRTFNCSTPHGLVAGNKFSIIDSSNNNRGTYIVRERINITSFTAITPSTVSVNNGFVLKHGLSSNDATSDSSSENLGVRSVPFFNEEILTAVSFTTSTRIRVSSPIGASAILKRFPIGTYIQIDEEIMRIASNTLGGTFNDEITVIRGALGTRQVTHDSNSIIRKIRPIPIEFRRPSIARASGHTFEYLGYGPGNYSTGLPQIQSITLTEREEFLVQSQERSGGIVVYTGMNNNGDSFVGNRKTSAATGEEITYDSPIPTVTGQNPSRLSVVFDEVTIKERLVVEGGNSGTILSQFDGPVTFNKEVKFANVITAKAQTKITDTTQSTTTTNGALTVSGGVGIAKNLSVGGDVNITGIATVNSLLDANGGATIDNIRIGIAGDNEIDTSTGNLTIDSAGGTTTIDDNVTISGTLNVTSVTTLSNNLNVTGATTLTGLLDANGGATIDNINIGVTGDNEIDTSTGNLTIDSAGGTTTIDDNLITSGTLNVTGATTLTGLLDANGGATIDNIRIGIAGDNEIDTSTGNLTIDSAGGTTTIDDNLIVGRTRIGPYAGSTSTANQTGLEILNNGGTGDGDVAAISFHCSGTYAMHMHLRSDGYFGIGGWSASPWRWYVNMTNGDMSAAGDIIAFVSDERLKENIQPLENALDKVLALNGFTYNFNEIGQSLGFDGSVRCVGVSAQEVQAVLPEAVKPAPADSNYITVQYEKLVPLLIEAIKELKAEIDELKGIK